MHFLPDTEIFKRTTISTTRSWPSACASCRFLNNGVRIRLIDERSGKEDDFSGAGGVKGFVDYINAQQERAAPHGLPRQRSRARPKLRRHPGTEIGVEVAMQWNDGYNEQVLCFTNNIPQRDGGTHLTGLRAAMTRVIGKYIEQNEAGQEGQGRGHRRRHARRPVLRAVGESARAQVQQPDQGQAGVSAKCARRWKTSSAKR